MEFNWNLLFAISGLTYFEFNSHDDLRSGALYKLNNKWSLEYSWAPLVHKHVWLCSACKFRLIDKTCNKEYKCKLLYSILTASKNSGGIQQSSNKDQFAIKKEMGTRKWKLKPSPRQHVIITHDVVSILCVDPFLAYATAACYVLGQIKNKK